jgi:hypothetical protein
MICRGDHHILLWEGGFTLDSMVSEATCSHM